MSSTSPFSAGRSGWRSSSVSASKTRIAALLYRREVPRVLVVDSPGCGLRIMEIGSVHGGGFEVQLFCTNGNCIFLAPVNELVTKPFRVPEEMLGKLGFVEPVFPG